MPNELSDPIGSDPLTKSRATLFSLLLMRLRGLHANRSAPTSYYIGQEYVDDHTRVDCTIAFILLYPGHVEQFQFWFNGANVKVRQSGNQLLVAINRKISSQLWDNLRLIGIGQQFIVGYIRTLLPQINRRLLDNRYLRGHLLSRTFAIFEVIGVSVTVSNRRILLNWPKSMLSFPPTLRFSGQVVTLYLRDYIDLIDAFFRNEYDDCIRRVIMSTENFIEEKKWNVKRNPRCYIVNMIKRMFHLRKRRNSSLRRILSDNLDCSLISNLVINENLQYVYRIRNKVVHNGYRIRITGGRFAINRYALSIILSTGIAETDSSRNMHSHCISSLQC